MILTLTVLMAVCSLSAQKPNQLPVPDLPIDERTNLVTYQDVVKQEGTPQVLYARAKAWVKKFYKNTAEVIKKTMPRNALWKCAPAYASFPSRKMAP